MIKATTAHFNTQEMEKEVSNHFNLKTLPAFHDSFTPDACAVEQFCLLVGKFS